MGCVCRGVLKLRNTFTRGLGLRYHIRKLYGDLLFDAIFLTVTLGAMFGIIIAVTLLVFNLPLTIALTVNMVFDTIVLIVYLTCISISHCLVRKRQQNIEMSEIRHYGRAVSIRMQERDGESQILAVTDRQHSLDTPHVVQYGTVRVAVPAPKVDPFVKETGSDNYILPTRDGKIHYYTKEQRELMVGYRQRIREHLISLRGNTIQHKGFADREIRDNLHDWLFDKEAIEDTLEFFKCEMIEFNTYHVAGADVIYDFSELVGEWYGHAENIIRRRNLKYLAESAV